MPANLLEYEDWVVVASNMKAVLNFPPDTDDIIMAEIWLIISLQFVA
jgi:hypothetical protein